MCLKARPHLQQAVSSFQSAILDGRPSRKDVFDINWSTSTNGDISGCDAESQTLWTLKTRLKKMNQNMQSHLTPTTSGDYLTFLTFQHFIKQLCHLPSAIQNLNFSSPDLSCINIILSCCLVLVQVTSFVSFSPDCFHPSRQPPTCLHPPLCRSVLSDTLRCSSAM